MKCPNCGKWNRASFPVCFSCGEPLPAVQERPRPAPQAPADKPDLPVHIVYNEFGDEEILVDQKDRLALEMQRLHERKRQGERQQAELRRHAARQGFAPTGSGVSAGSRRSRMFIEAARTRSAFPPDPREPQVDYDGYTQVDSYNRSTGHYETLPQMRRGKAVKLPRSRGHRARLFGIRRFLPALAILILIGAGLFAGYEFLYKPMAEPKPLPEEEQVQVAASILDDMAAHTIRIPAPEGSEIYIKELRRSFIVVDGYASFQVEDHIWYEGQEGAIPPSMDVNLTPFIRTGTGEQKPLPIVSYTIQIPLSPLTLIRPDSSYVAVATPIYNIQFHVLQHSTVFINGEDYSSYVNTQNGLISYNAAIQPIGDNKVHIKVRSQYYRENELTLTIYRAVQDIPLDLSSTLVDRSTDTSMTISATTRAGATVTILSPYHKLDTSLLNSTGAFKFDAVFTRIGINTVIIRAEYPGKEPTIIEYDVYHLPDPDHYTPKAWALNAAFGYPDLLANLSTRVKNTQIYVLTGPVTEIKSTKPQLVVFDCADGQGSPLEALVENQTRTEWVLGQRYRIYADVVGSYGGIPRLIARYTYNPVK